jgi:hypothetical protein
LTAWQLYGKKVLAEALSTEVERLKVKLGKKSDSIWTSNKAELVELARAELGMTIAAAERETITVLKERLRSRRQMLKTAVDPLDLIPKGLERMKLDELKEEIEKRKLPLPPKATRPALIVLIRDDVTNRSTLNEYTYLTPPTAPEANQDSNKTGGDEDWTMADTENPQGRRRVRFEA